MEYQSKNKNIQSFAQESFNTIFKDIYILDSLEKGNVTTDNSIIHVERKRLTSTVSQKQGFL